MPDNYPLTLKIITHEGLYSSFECDSVRLFAADNEKGDGGGAIGFRRNCLPALVMLRDGMALAFRDGVQSLAVHISGGFASVADNIVTVLADSVVE